MALRAGRLPSAILVRWVLILILGGAVGYWGWQKFKPKVPLQDKSSTRFNLPVTDQNLLKGLLEIEAQQNQLDRTVWATESLAEEHEDVFIKLWDDLRSNEDEYSILEQFRFRELLLGKPGLKKSHEHGIVEFRLDQSPEKIGTESWRLLLKELKENGYRIEQTEWRHAQFDPGPPATSIVYLEAHVHNDTGNERFILRGNLRVEWEEGPDPRGARVAARIDATGISVVSRQGDTAFRAALSSTLAPEEGTIFIDPLIVYDLDGDGLSEIILGCKNLVFRNRGHGTFQKETLCRPSRGLIGTCIVADFDGDGLADFLAADRDGLLLYRGDKEGRFTQGGRRVWSSSEPLLNPFVMTAGDIDGDGDLDVWLAQYKLPYVGGQMPTPYDDANDGFPSYLLINNGRGDFREATVDAGLAGKRFRRTYSCSFVDLDNDGDLDLVVVSDFAGADVYFNDGRGHFVDSTDKVLDERHSFGMSHTFGDYDGDGHLDFLMIGMNSFVARRLDHLNLGPGGMQENQGRRSRMGHGNRMYFSDGDRFRQTSLSGQVAGSGWSWGATSFDFDNDGDLDVYIVNGHKSRQSVKDYETQFWRHDIYVATSRLHPVIDLYFRSTAERLYGAGWSYGGHEKNRLFLNESGKAFLEAGYLMGVSAEEDCRNVVSDDLDGDGKLDLILTTFEEWPEAKQGLHILQNRATDVGNWVEVQLREGGPGYSPIGARITIETTGGRQFRQIVTGDSYRSQHANTAHFGLGKETNINSIEVRWLNGRVRKIFNPAINRSHAVRPE